MECNNKYNINLGNLSNKEFNTHEKIINIDKNTENNTCELITNQTYQGLSTGYQDKILSSENFKKFGIKKIYSAEKIFDTNNLTTEDYNFQDYKRFWTKEDDELLLNFVKSNKNRNWRKISKLLKNKTPQQCSYRFSKIYNIKNEKKWNRKEDIELIELTEKFGFDWEKISSFFPTRTLEDITDRYTKKLNPELKKIKLESDEDEKIISLHNIHGNKWNLIAKHFKDKTGSIIKKKYYSVIKQKNENTETITDNSSINEYPIGMSNNINKTISITKKNEYFNSQFYNNSCENINNINLNYSYNEENQKRLNLTNPSFNENNFNSLDNEIFNIDFNDENNPYYLQGKVLQNNFSKYNKNNFKEKNENNLVNNITYKNSSNNSLFGDEDFFQNFSNEGDTKKNSTEDTLFYDIKLNSNNMNLDYQFDFEEFLVDFEKVDKYSCDFTTYDKNLNNFNQTNYFCNDLYPSLDNVNNNENKENLNIEIYKNFTNFSFPENNNILFSNCENSAKDNSTFSTNYNQDSKKFNEEIKEKNKIPIYNMKSLEQLINDTRMPIDDGQEIYLPRELIHDDGDYTRLNSFSEKNNFQENYNKIFSTEKKINFDAIENVNSHLYIGKKEEIISQKKNLIGKNFKDQDIISKTPNNPYIQMMNYYKFLEAIYNKYNQFNFTKIKINSKNRNLNEIQEKILKEEKKLEEKKEFLIKKLSEIKIKYKEEVNDDKDKNFLRTSLSKQIDIFLTLINTTKRKIELIKDYEKS